SRAEARITARPAVPRGAGAAGARLGAARRDAAEVVKEIKAIAEFNEVPLKSAVRTDISAEDAILRQARQGRHDLIVLGVSRRPGRALSFGELPTALLESADRSLMFIAPSAAPQARGAGANKPAAQSAAKASECLLPRAGHASLRDALPTRRLRRLTPPPAPRRRR